MTELDRVISAAYASKGKQEDVNKVYVTLLQAILYLPVRKEKTALTSQEEPFQPLFALIENKYFMLAFDTLERLTTWAEEQINNIDYVEITGRDLIAGINEKVFLVMNVGSSFHKEFSPDEIIHLKKIVSKIDQLKK